MVMQMLNAHSRNGRWQIIMLLILAAGCYSLSLDAPFYLDDYSSVLFNPAIQQGLDWSILLREQGARIVTYASFALTYQINGGNSTLPYHVFNLLLHLAASLVFWRLSYLILKQAGTRNANWVALVAVALFALHPLQSQAVIYIAQRATGLVALFYLTGMAAYLEARIHGRKYWYLIALIAAVAAAFSKQNAATLPFALLLLELLVLPNKPATKKVLALVGAVTVMAGLAAMVMIPEVSDKLRETKEISRSDYLTTQMQVLWIYFGKFVWPMNLRLEYDTALVTSWLNVATILALLGHFIMLGIAWLSRKSHAAIGFGIIFYYLAHSIESSIFPISDLVFEHRTYLPNAGLAIACVAAGDSLAMRWQGEKTLRLIAWVLIALLVALTAKRNLEWRDPLAFHQKNAELAPASYRPWLALNSEYLKRGDLEQAEASIDRALYNYRQMEKNDQAFNSDLFHNWIFTLMRAGKYAELIVQVNRAEPQFAGMNPYLLSNIYAMRGRAQAALGKLPQAETDLKKAVEINVKNAAAWTNLGTVNAMTGRYLDAKTCYEKALNIDPNQLDAQANLEKLQALLY